MFGLRVPVSKSLAATEFDGIQAILYNRYFWLIYYYIYINVCINLQIIKIPQKEGRGGSDLPLFIRPSIREICLSHIFESTSIYEIER